MEQASLTALMSLFIREYHSRGSGIKVFDDPIASRLITAEEKSAMENALRQGAAFFSRGPLEEGEDALQRVMEQLSPLPLGRAAFAEKSLERAVFLGARQYLILGAGYDSFAFRQPSWAKKLAIFELDHPATAREKQQRLQASGFALPENLRFLPADFSRPGWQKPLLEEQSFSGKEISFCSLMGVSYYLSKEAFAMLAAALGSVLLEGSAFVFDYPEGDSPFLQQQRLLAAKAGEPMTEGYSLIELERLLARQGFLIFEQLSDREITKQYFSDYNESHPLHPLQMPQGVGCCLAVKK